MTHSELVDQLFSYIFEGVIKYTHQSLICILCFCHFAENVNGQMNRQLIFHDLDSPLCDYFSLQILPAVMYGSWMETCTIKACLNLPYRLSPWVTVWPCLLWICHDHGPLWSRYRNGLVCYVITWTSSRSRLNR